MNPSFTKIINRLQRMAIDLAPQYYALLPQSAKKNPYVFIAAARRNLKCLKHIPLSELSVDERLRAIAIFNDLINKDPSQLIHLPDGLKKNELALSKESQLQTKAFLENLITQNQKQFEHLPDIFKSYELCLSIVTDNSKYLRHVPARHKTLELCTLAMFDNFNEIEHINPALIDDILDTLAMHKYGTSIDNNSFRYSKQYILEHIKKAKNLNYIPSHYFTLSLSNAVEGLTFLHDILLRIDIHLNANHLFSLTEALNKFLIRRNIVSDAENDHILCIFEQLDRLCVDAQNNAAREHYLNKFANRSVSQKNQSRGQISKICL